MNSTHAATNLQTDGLDRIRSVDAAWIAFALENDAPELTRDAVLGRLLWDFVEGPELKLLYQGLSQRVRESGGTIEFSCRCDSPNQARWMRMRIERVGENGGLRFESRTERVEPRSPISMLDTNHGEQSNGTLPICSVCKAIRLGDETWVDVEEAVTKLELASNETLPRLSHGICPPCAQRLR